MDGKGLEGPQTPDGNEQSDALAPVVTVSPPSSPLSEELDASTIAANKVAEELDAAIFLYSGSIDSKGFGLLFSELAVSASTPRRPNALLLLTTYGGSANDAYRIARVMQMISRKFTLCIPAMCKSAGTLIALGANRIMMNDISELGPLDVQLRQRDEIGEIRSGMVIRTALEGLTEETFALFEHVMLSVKQKSRNTVSLEVSSRIATNLTAQVMAPIYAQIDPHNLGTDLRDLNVATAYGRRLSKYGKNVRNRTIDRLVEEYPSHDFIIDKEEAEDLFHKVDDLSADVNRLVVSLGRAVYSPQSPHVVKRLDRLVEDPNEETEEVDASHTPVDGGRQEPRNGDHGGE